MDKLTKGLKTIATEKLLVTVNMDKDGTPTISCTYTPSCGEPGATGPIQAELYIVGDLAFYGMLLGKEGISGKWCHLCKMSAAEMTNLMASGEPWDGIHEMKQLASDQKKKLKDWEDTSPRKRTKTPPQPNLGMKDEPWWDFIPLDHYIVPLLHCEIGIGDLILSAFREFVSENIEYISSSEKDTRQSKAKMEEMRIETLQAQRDAYKESNDGNILNSLKGKVTRAQAALKDLGAIGKVGGVVKKSRKRVLDWDKVFDKINLFVEECIKGEDGLEGSIDDINLF